MDSIIIKKLQEEYDTGKSVRKLSNEYGYSTYMITKNIKQRELKRNFTNSQKVTNWRRRAKKKLVEYKGGKCIICDYNKCIKALEFHHINPKDKSFRINSNTMLSHSNKDIIKELSKCILLCSNCHRELHYFKNH